MSYFLSPDDVLLGHENQTKQFGGLEVAFSGCGLKDAAAITEDSFFKKKREALRFGRRIFTRVEEEEVGNDDNITIRN